MTFNIYTLIAFIVYFAIVLAIGIACFRRSKNMNDYFLGGRGLGTWTAAISAQASDMSGWLLLGLPGSVFVAGLTESWIAVGLFIGTYLNWRLIASRLRKMSAAADDAITIPEYFQNRFKSKSPVVRFVCAAIIFVFFLVYTASAFSSGAKLFEFVFGIDYVLALSIGAVIIIAYTFLGGFLAVCWTDLIQGLLMLAALVFVPILCLANTPDFTATQFEASNYLSMFETTDGGFAWQTILSGLAWGLGYFGMPHILVRFMAIKSADMIKKSRIIATVWVLISLGMAVLVGVVGYAYLHAAGNEALLEQFNALGDAERIFMFLSSSLLPSLLAGIVLCAILAAIMSTADSQLLVTASAVTNDVFKLLNKKASEKTQMWISRITVVVVAVIAYLLALDPTSSVMDLVSYAWAGLGAAFGPAILLSLFWKKMNITGAVAGMIVGGAAVILWEMLCGATGIYSLLPAFLLSLLAVVIGSKVSGGAPEGVDELFAKASAKQLD
ncbi:MAG: sodium/proline symporter PutP [Bacteroides sp.]|nr:sodium/proline symporter PutP [Eubacterium sp.]MCM1419336.1 sodium/proline symporter PutP [Roseburia sp.]MCM1462024.1 sodium/proline symporter PutP [Bacteroides sp.]